MSGCAGRAYGRPKGWIAALSVQACTPLLRRKVRAIHSISTYVQEILRRDFLDERDPTKANDVIHDVISSVPQEHYASREGQADLARLNELPSEPFLLFVGALRRVKGVEQLLAAYDSLKNPPPLVLIGTLEVDSPPLSPRPSPQAFGYSRTSITRPSWQHGTAASLPSYPRCCRSRSEP